MIGVPDADIDPSAVLYPVGDLDPVDEPTEWK